MTLQLVTISGAIVGTLILVLMVQVLAMRALLVVRTRRTARLVSLWQPLLIRAVEAPPSNLPRLDAADVFTFLALWNHLQESVLDQAKQGLNDVARRMGVPAIAHRMLERANLRGRLMAVATLGQLQDRSVWGPLCTFAASPHVVLSLAAARALIQIDRHAAVERLMPLIAIRLDWPAARVANLLSAAGADVISDPLARTAIAASPRHAPRLIRYLDVIHCETAIPAVRQIIREANDMEVIAACLRIFKDPEDLDTVRGFLDHPRWEIRVQAATAIGRLGTAGDEERLALLLNDPEWWVRYRSAHALCALLADSPGRLDRLQREHVNRFARDVLTQARAERLLR